MSRFSILTAAATLCLLWPAAARVAAAPQSGVGNLGDSLLDDELAKSLAPAPEKASPDKAGGDWLPDEEMLRRLLDQGDGGTIPESAGEDVGESPLASVVSGMKRAEGLIADDADDRVAVPVQREVVAKLERLIAQMEKQCQGGSCNKPSDGDKEKQASKRSQPKPGQPKQGKGDKPSKQVVKAGRQANQSGTTNLAGAPTASAAEQQELMKAAWGHLPERVREQMLQGAGGEFLPEYRDELQAYFRRLAERSAREAP